jgi:hypothetical protein
MSLLMPAGGATVTASYTADAVLFDGTNDYGTRASFVGAADSKVGIISMWMNIQATSASQQMMSSDGEYSEVRDSSDKIALDLSNSGGGGSVAIKSSTSYNATTNTGWHHYLWSWNVATPTRLMYVDDADDIGTNNSTNATADWTRSTMSIGAKVNGSYKANIFLFDFFLDTTTFLDITQESNRRLFIDDSGKPVDLLADGSGPTSSQPIMFLHIPTAAAANTFLTDNKGSGGDFSVSGALTTASSTPTD